MFFSGLIRIHRFILDYKDSASNVLTRRFCCIVKRKKITLRFLRVPSCSYQIEAEQLSSLCAGSMGNSGNKHKSDSYQQINEVASLPLIIFL